MMNRILVILVLLALSVTVYGENKGQNARRQYLDTLYFRAYENFSTPKGLFYIDQYIEESQRQNNVHAEASGINLKVGSYINLGMHQRVAELSDSVENSDIKEKYPTCYYYVKYILAQSYSYQGKYKLAMQKAQELYDDSHGYEVDLGKDKDGRINKPEKLTNRLNALSCMGMTEYCMGHFEKAIEHYNECLEITARHSDELAVERRDAFDGRMVSALKIDDNERKLGYLTEYDEYLKAYKLRQLERGKEKDDFTMYEFYIHDAYVNVYVSMNEIDKAKEHVVKMREIMNITVQAYDNLAGTFYSTMSRFYMASGEFDKAFVCADSATCYTHDFDASAELDALKLKLLANHKMRRFAKDYDIAQEIMALSDSLAKETKNSNIDEVSTLLGMDKLKIEAQEAKARQQMLVMAILVVLLLTSGGVSVFIQVQKRRREQEKRRLLSEQNERLEIEVLRQTRELRDKNEEIMTQNEVLDEKNRIISQSNQDMKDSISYAKRIQNALMPDIERQCREKGLEGVFALFRPRDIVSGDFYWSREHGDEMLVACADCTGHGVPGAFMSLIGTTILNEICARESDVEPSKVLTILDSQIIEALNQRNDTNVTDGMDLALVSYNQKTMEMRYSLARRPLYIIRNGELEKIRGTKRSIGDKDEMSMALPFESGIMKMEKGDMVYMCSDGIADQFGGVDEEHPHGKRLKSAGLHQMLLRISALPIGEQKIMLEKELMDWQGDCEQVDDISLVGMKI